LPNQVIDDLCGKLLIKEYAKEERIISKGDPGRSMYIILKGEVIIHDEEMEVAILNQSQFFGEFSLLDDEPRSMSVTAKESAVAGKLSQQHFFEVLNSYPAVLKDVTKTLIQRIRVQNNKLIEQMKVREQELESMVKERTQSLIDKNIELARVIDELNRYQEQLILQEKLATLGQLTAGIAHEIKNPLNFVNNFSSISMELIEEYSNSKNDDEKNELILLIKENLSRIAHHGDRANNIVNSMMQHSRKSSEQKSKVDINHMLEESLNFAMHGMKSSELNMKVNLEKSYGENLAPLSVIPNDMNRVFINIFSNAFYAMKLKLDHHRKNNIPFEPSLQIKTYQEGNNVKLILRDNGAGIPKEIKDKIFNPFFTTKPTGQGTGLGLSISFDILKAHGGNIDFDSEDGSFTQFTISIPAV